MTSLLRSLEKEVTGIPEDASLSMDIQHEIVEDLDDVFLANRGYLTIEFEMCTCCV